MDTRDEQYLTKAELEICKSSPEARKHYVQSAKSKLEAIQKNYCLFENRNVLQSDDTDELRIVVIGKTGVGKSATANSIVNRKAFKEGMGSKSATMESKCDTACIKGRRVKVIDTPGLFDTNLPQEAILNEIARVIQIFDCGIHAFLYVLNMSTPRFTEEDNETLKTVEEKFGGQMNPYRLIVYTHAESLADDMNLDSFVRKQRNSNPSLKKLFEASNNNVVALNNRTSIPAEKKRNQNILIAMIDKIRRSNGSCPVYTNTTFQIAAQKMKDLSDKAISNGLSPKIMNSFQAVHASSMQLVRDPRKLFNALKKHKGKKTKAGEKHLEQQPNVEGVKYDFPSEEEIKQLMESTETGEEIDLAQIPDDALKAVAEIDVKQMEEICIKIYGVTLYIQNVLRDLWQKRGLL